MSGRTWQEFERADVSRPDHPEIPLIHRSYSFETKTLSYRDRRRVDNVEAEIRVRRDQLENPSPVFGPELDDVDL